MMRPTETPAQLAVSAVFATHPLMASVKGYRLATGYSLLRPKDVVDEERWEGMAEFSNRSLREFNAIEVRVDDDAVIRLEPASPAVR